jgi:hypothetical protein
LSAEVAEQLAANENPPSEKKEPTDLQQTN